MIAVTFAILALHFPDGQGFTPASTDVSFIRDTGLALGAVLFVVWAYVMIAGTSNGVNLTDGLDGLATGTSVMVFASYVLIGIWQFGENCAAPTRRRTATRCATRSTSPSSPRRSWAPASASCGGTRHRPRSSWATPARWPSAARSPGIAILSRTELLLVLVGGLFVLIALSVIVQVGFFKLTRRRVFRMAPLQHHFELVGLGRGHDRHPVLDHRRAAGRARPRRLLRRVGRRRTGA